MTDHRLILVSHHLSPYVQRAVIALSEKGVPFERRYVDLADKPDWFRAISPLGRTPVLKIGEAALFESAAILEYLEDTQPGPLHPADPVERAHHRAWIGFGSETLNDIAGFYSARDMGTLEAKAAALHARFRLLEAHLSVGPWFAGARFSLVDAVFAPVFRYFDTFDRIGEFGVFDGMEKVPAWRTALAGRPSARAAVAVDYGDRLTAFLRRRDSALAQLTERASAAMALSA